MFTRFGLGFAYNALKLRENKHDVTVVGHRGMSPKGVENSIESLEAAAKLEQIIQSWTLSCQKMVSLLSATMITSNV